MPMPFFAFRLMNRNGCNCRKHQEKESIRRRSQREIEKAVNQYPETTRQRADRCTAAEMTD